MTSIYLLSFNQIELEDLEVFLTEEEAKERLMTLYRTIGQQQFKQDNYHIEILQASEQGGFRMTYQGFEINDQGEFVIIENH